MIFFRKIRLIIFRQKYFKVFAHDNKNKHFMITAAKNPVHAQKNFAKECNIRRISCFISDVEYMGKFYNGFH